MSPSGKLLGLFLAVYFMSLIGMSTVSAEESCPPGAVWSTCSNCHAYCKNKDLMCITACQEGCKCTTQGYKIHNNECIPAEKCP
uniref:Hylaserpin S2 n=1 Tax=Hyla simplex TaxID=334658 RepID=H6SWL0_9NEOB|nr:hylaserpin S2 [Hyla simplex]